MCNDRNDRHKFSTSYYSAKIQGLAEVTKILADFVNLVVVGKTGTEENSFGCGNI